MAALIRYALVHPDFQRAVFGDGARRVVVRTVAVRGAVRVQVSRDRGTDVETRNHPTPATVVGELTAVAFRTAHVELRTQTIEARVTKRGRLLVSRRAADNDHSLAHDRVRERPVPEDAPFLEELGVSRGGAVVPTARRKYRQINEFVRILGSTVDGPARVLDLGCGNAYLTFATAYHLGGGCTVTGVDRDATTIARNTERARRLGWQDRLTFTAAPIDRYAPPGRPDLVTALHACDTATDDVLALAVRTGVDRVLAAPCCHHDLQRQLRRRTAPAAFRDLTRDGILTEQLGDVVTDALRASLLRVVGYRVDVSSFVPVEHTPRNNLIRAVRTGGADPAAVDSVRALTGLFGVRPRLADLLRDRLPPDLAGNPVP
jgi:SAM-dependent methyltransferase